MYYLFALKVKDTECGYITHVNFLCALQDLSKAQVLIFANKQDLKGSMSAAELSQHLNLTSIKDHGWHVQACCALTGEG